jgi:hypothetical protein
MKFGYKLMTEEHGPRALAQNARRKRLAAIRNFVDVGFDHICLMALGPDHAAFIDFFARELKPRLGAVAA